ncbi:MAG: sulfatase [Bryobacteraceae bacterium]|nr:sulfatase [Bryobacteraceae bacterium]
MSADMTRRAFLAASSATPLACRRTERRPNFLFVIADDQSFPHAGAYGCKGIRTPAFDRVANEGVLFTNSFCASPSCTPSRSTILTGRQVWQIEQAGLLYGTIPTKYPLMTHLLEDSGYHAGFTGKGWGPGDWRAGGLTRHPIGKEYSSRRHATAPRTGIDPRDYAANFADFMRDRPSASPFFFWLGATEPHRIYANGAGLATGHKLDEVQAPAYWPDTPEVRGDILDYYSEVEWFDQQLAQALNVLEKTGELDNTLVVVTSDNGMPFPRAKVNLYDSGVHMPLAMRWGARVKGGRTVDDFVQHIDFAPTFLAAAGLSVPSATTGRSLLPLLDSSHSGVIEPSRDAMFTSLERHVMARPDGQTYPMRSIRTRDYIYIRNFMPDRWPTGGEFLSSNRTTHGDVDGAPIRDFMLEPSNQARFARQYDLCFGRRPAEEFYHLPSDPDQIRNLAPQGHPELDAHRKRLEENLRATGDPRIEGRDPWQGYVYYQTAGYGASFNKSLSEEVRAKASGAARHKPE